MGTPTPALRIKSRGQTKDSNWFYCMLLYLNTHYLHFEFAPTHTNEMTQNQM